MPMTDSPGALRHPRAALALLSLSQLLIALDATIVFVALDAMGQQLQMDAHHLQWVVSAYSVAFGGCLLLGGRCADLLGKRRMYVAGMALFGLASLVGGFASQPWQLVLGRAGQGVAGALLFPATLSLINTLYAAGPERNRALAVWSMASAGGLAAGALLRRAHADTGLELGAVGAGARGLAVCHGGAALSAALGPDRARRAGPGL